MAVKVQIRRGVWMYHAEVPTENVVTAGNMSALDLKPEVEEWIEARGFDSDRYSNAWTYYTYGHHTTSDFYFADAQVAILFKLTFG